MANTSDIIKIAFALLYLIGLIGNMLLIIVFWRNKYLRKAPNILILNLAILCIFHISCNAITILTMTTMRTLDDQKCRVMVAAQYVFMAGNAWNLVCFSSCRYKVTEAYIESKHERRRVSSMQVAVPHVISVWVVAVILAVPFPSAWESADKRQFCRNSKSVKFELTTNFIINFVLPIVVTTVYYILTNVRVSRHERDTFAQILHKYTLQLNHIGRDRNLLALLFLFIVTNLPVYILYFIKFWNNSHQGMSSFDIKCLMLYSINTCFSPIAVYFSKGRIRDSLKRYFECPCRSGDVSFRSQLLNLCIKPFRRSKAGIVRAFSSLRNSDVFLSRSSVISLKSLGKLRTRRVASTISFKEFERRRRILTV